jgi:hypothetical protein
MAAIIPHNQEASAAAGSWPPAPPAPAPPLEELEAPPAAVDQRAIKIEYDNAGRSHRSLAIDLRTIVQDGRDEALRKSGVAEYDHA